MFDFLRDRYKHNVDKYQQDQELKIVNDVLDAINEQTPQCVDNRQMSFYKLKCEIPKIKQLVETNDERINRYSYVSFKNLLEENIKLKKCNEALESQLEMLKKHFNKDEIKKQEFLNKYKDCSAEKLQRYIELSDVYIESGMKSILENIEDCESIRWICHEVKISKIRKKAFEELLRVPSTEDAEKDALKAEIDRLQNRVNESEDQNYKLSQELTDIYS